MNRKSNLKKGFTCMALAALIAATGVVPGSVVSAQTNTQASVDKVADGVLKSFIPVGKKEITLNKGGVYQLKAKVSSIASGLGFRVVGNGQKVEVTYADGEKEVFNLTWKSADSKTVKVTKDGKITGVNVSTTVDGKYVPTKVKAYIDTDKKFTDKDGVVWSFENAAVFTENVVVVPTADLDVYFQGVWSESSSDNNAQHITDYDVRESNVKAQLKAMAEAVTGHCKGTSYDVVAYTKTNDDTVRAYIRTYSKKAGTHYYVMKFTTSKEGVNKITVTERDYCENEYSVSGTYSRGKN